MKRVKWLRAESRLSIRELAKRLGNTPFGEDAESGFLLDRARDNFLEARFIEKSEYVETFTDPFGNSQSIERIVYKQVEFSLTKNVPQLELHTPPRGLSGFQNALLKASDFSMSLETCHVDLLRWTRAIEKALGARGTLRGAVASDIELADGATARIGISAPKDARNALAEILTGRKHNLSTVNVDLTLNGALHKIVLTSDCTMRCSDRVSDSELDGIRAALTDILTK
jgi:hypothetical protein